MSLVSALKNLLIPRKSSAEVTDLDTDWRAIEIWAQQVVAAIKSISGGGFVPYASLTGPGETMTPGKLTQEGEFDIVGNTVVTGGLAVTDGTVSLTLNSSAFEVLADLIGISSIDGVYAFKVNRSADFIDVQGAGGTVQVNATQITIDGTALAFFDGTHAAGVGQHSSIASPTGGATIDSQARTAINSILDVLSASRGGFGLTA